MSRDPEAVARITENTYKNVMDQFNPGLRNLVNLGRNYEKAVSVMVQAGKAYYDGLTKVGEMTTVSPVSKELGLVLQEISSVHKKLNESFEENFRKFHREIIGELEKKTDQDIKYMNATLKRFQTEHRHKIDSLEKSQSDLKKLRRKSQGTKNGGKYDMKESEYMETINSRQNDIQKFIVDGCKDALLEEKRRFCFLVDRHCSFANYLNYYHIQSTDLLTAKIPKWQEICTDVAQVPDNISNMIPDLNTPGTTPISGTPDPSPLMDKKALMGVNNDTISRNTLRMPPAPPSKAHPSPLVDMFNNPAAPQKPTFNRLPSQGENNEESSLPRSLSVATGLNMMKKSKVRTIFPHTGNSKTLLSFQQGDVITLLIPEEKDGWLYGEHDTTKVKGWFPSSYTRPLEENGRETMQMPSMNPSPAPMRSLSSANLTEKNNMVLPEPDYLDSSSLSSSSDREQASFTPPFAKQSALFSSNESPKSAQKPTPNGVMKHPFLSGENPFVTVKLRPTVTNDRSAPVI
ncbi:PREDICTED: brain-specific angiogenesis inhibitor 1-associated protein 2-like protein 1 [Nanorana parkeri]|uniref:brain-specific angiogenesis inhibitor 1-associated protein 2-like protein 1 n=1 Tax=Nanorana parkeri TaxID=125878 RepID=UPI0008545A6F|nr:PREDICTED: brain-specific angiogenesis inhibitor 1-associated protein 2-like protein 1 [Nanorana parkeri]